MSIRKTQVLDKRRKTTACVEGGSVNRIFGWTEPCIHLSCLTFLFLVWKRLFWTILALLRLGMLREGFCIQTGTGEEKYILASQPDGSG